MAVWYTKQHTRPVGPPMGKSVLPLAQPAKLKRDLRLLLPLGALLGILAFIAIYGVAVLNPTNVAWIEERTGDLQQHYTGWVMYRNTPWTFPIGLTDRLTYPHPVSITYSDSIPLFAVFFKLLSPILPANFQYFGFWGLLSYMLTGALGVALVRSFCPNKLYCLVGGAFFATATTIVFRMYDHTALGGQWIVLLALALWVYGDCLHTLKRTLACWCGLLFLAAWVHPYFLPMVAGVLLFSLLHSALYHRHIPAHLAALAAPLLTAVVALWSIGAFVGGGNMQNGGLGMFSFNLNGFWNPLFDDWSSLLNAQNSGPGQFEGYAYMGVGLLLLMALGMALLLWRVVRALVRCGVRQTLRQIPMGVVLLLMLGGIFGIIALSQLVTANGVELFTIPYPGFVLTILDIFRATGRFIWVPYFILMLGGLWLFWRCAPKRVVSVALLCALLCVQLYDLAPYYAWRRDSVKAHGTEGTLQSAAWGELAAGYAHFVVDTLPADYSYSFALGAVARQGGATLSNYALARSLPEAQNTIREYYATAADSALPRDTALVFFTPKDATVLRWLNDGGTYFYNLDGLVVCTPAPLSSATEPETLLPMEGPLDVLASLPATLYLADRNEAGEFLLQPTGDLRGQQVYMPAGTYAVTFTGTGLLAEHVQPYSTTRGRDGDNGITSTLLEETGESITLRFTLEYDIYDFELWVENPLEEPVTLRGITLSAAP